MSPKLKALIEKLHAKQDALDAIFKQARDGEGNYDLLKADALKDCKTMQAAVDQVRALEKECDDLHKETKQLEDLELADERNRKHMEARERIDRPMVHPTGKDTRKDARVKLLHELVADDWQAGVKRARNGLKYYGEFEDFEFKTLMSTTAGFEPEVTRTGRIVEFAHRPIQVSQLFPVGTTGQQAISWMEETTSTNAAAETAEAGAYPEATFVFSPKQTPVQKIAVWIPVTDEQLEDAPFIQSLIEGRLSFFCEQRLDGQALNGNGTPPNLRGVLNTVGIQTYALLNESITDAVFKGMTLVRVTGRAVASGLVMHPNNWQTVRLMRTTDGIYIWGSPSEAGPERMWGVPVAQGDAIVEHTALVGDFQAHSQLVTRRGIEVEVGFINDQFVKGTNAIRASFRMALAVYRPTAFCTVTNLNAHVDVPVP